MKEKFEFKVMKPRKIASMWGETKKIKDMTYEKFGRSLRYYKGKTKVPGKGMMHVFSFDCDIVKILGFDPTAESSVEEDWEFLKKSFGLIE
ncbi:hypothetical protein QZH41_003988 [Actinostola sp. cb2023]|nr:hypothetical protein QZH41_003988 [Actinostola sp. cb2023]